MKKVSIVVPVYNVQNYLEKCLDSLIHQTLKDIEIIVVNDGSTDQSQEIIDRYQMNFPDRIIALKKKNGGLSDARNFGVAHATGEYLGFLDSDDFASEHIYEKMYETAKQQDADLIVSNLEYFWDDHSQPSFCLKGLSNWNEDSKKAIFLSPLFAWNKLYRREKFIQLDCQYPIGLWYEDIPVTLKFAAHANRIAHCDETGFFYRQRKTSIMGSSFNPKMYHIFDIISKTLNELKSSGSYSFYKTEVEYLVIEQLLLYGAFRFLKTEHYSDLTNKSFDFVQNEFKHWRKNPYLKKHGLKNRIFLQTHFPFTTKLWHAYFIRR